MSVAYEMPTDRPRHRFLIEEYERMIEFGILDETLSIVRLPGVSIAVDHVFKAKRDR